MNKNRNLTIAFVGLLFVLLVLMWHNKTEQVKSAKKISNSRDYQEAEAFLRSLPATQIQNDDAGNIILVSSGRRIDDDAVIFLTRLPSLKELYLFESDITARGVEELSGIKRLEKLTIVGEHIDNKCSELIAKMPNIKELVIGTKRISDDAVTSISLMKSLKYICLVRTSISNIGLHKLQLELKDAYIDGGI